MTPKHIDPALGLDSFGCPHCGAIAHQFWFEVLVEAYASGNRPPSPQDFHARLLQGNPTHADVSSVMALVRGAIMLRSVPLKAGTKPKAAMVIAENLSVSRCYSCKCVAVWVGQNLVYPAVQITKRPHDVMPEDVQADFLEAASIVDLSSRGAAALLRLAIQKLMVHVGEKGKHLDTDISHLVSKGLEPTIQQSLDIVRVIGNESVHPGQIDLRDDKETALHLFDLLNIIVERLIATPKRIGALYELLPSEKREAIRKRDKNKP